MRPSGGGSSGLDRIRLGCIELGARRGEARPAEGSPRERKKIGVRVSMDPLHIKEKRGPGIESRSIDEDVRERELQPFLSVDSLKPRAVSL